MDCLDWLVFWRAGRRAGWLARAVASVGNEWREEQSCVKRTH